MKKSAMGNGTLVFDQNAVFYELNKSDCNVNQAELSTISKIAGIGFDFHAFFTEYESKLVMQFFIEEGFIPLIQFRSQNLSRRLKLLIGKNLLLIGRYFSNHDHLVTVFDPLNFFAHQEDGTVLVLYRGLKGLMPAPGYYEEPLVEQVKRLILFLLTTAHFDQLWLIGNSFANRCIIEEYRTVTKALIRAKTLEEMERVLDEELRELEQKQVVTQVVTTDQPAATDIRKLFFDYKNILVNHKNILVVGVIAGAILLVSSVYAMGGSDQKYPDQYILGLREAATQDYMSAEQSFSQVDINSLPPEDKKAVVAFYANIGEVNKASQIDPGFMKNLANDYPVAPGLQFEKAVMKNDYEQIVKLKDKIVLDDRRYRLIVEAYIKLNKLKSAAIVAKESKNPSLMLYVEDLLKKKSSQTKPQPNSPQPTTQVPVHTLAHHASSAHTSAYHALAHTSAHHVQAQQKQ